MTVCAANTTIASHDTPQLRASDRHSGTLCTKPDSLVSANNVILKNITPKEVVADSNKENRSQTVFPVGRGRGLESPALDSRVRLHL